MTPKLATRVKLSVQTDHKFLTRALIFCRCITNVKTLIGYVPVSRNMTVCISVGTQGNPGGGLIIPGLSTDFEIKLWDQQPLAGSTLLFLVLIAFHTYIHTYIHTHTHIHTLSMRVSVMHWQGLCWTLSQSVLHVLRCRLELGLPKCGQALPCPKTSPSGWCWAITTNTISMSLLTILINLGRPNLPSIRRATTHLHFWVWHSRPDLEIAGGSNTPPRYSLSGCNQF